MESKFKAHLIKRLREEYPGAIILKNDANILQGFPDLLLLYGPRWAALETKDSATSRKQPNQKYYVELTDQMSFGAFIYPENERVVLDELQRSFRFRR